MIPGAAIAGCGLVGAKRARALVQSGVPIIAVVDANPSRARALAESLPDPVPAVASSPQAAFAQDGVGLAVVATTHDALAPLALEALAAGCHVLVEKPGATRPADLERVRSLSRASGLLVRVGLNHRFHPAMRRAHKIVRSGDHGSIMNIRARYGHGGRVGYENEWRADRDRSGGGELLDQGMHLIDLVRFFAGEVSLAFSELRSDFWKTSVEDNAFLAMESHDGAFAWLHASWTEWKNLFSFEIAMERAKVEIAGLGGSYGTERLSLHEMLPEMGPPMTTMWEWPRGDNSWALEIEDFLGTLDGGPGLGATVDDGIAALRLVEAAYTQ